ncbi:MAG: protein translocase subunit SecD, partial [Desulfuromonadales bacterium]|nr:protein translocase subunit SecD [Desulfuromonadales bacterium]
MSNSLKIRTCVVLACLALALVSLGPTLSKDGLPNWWYKAFDPIHLGLDLQGGMHLVLGVKVDEAVESRLDTIVDQADDLLREKDVIFKRVDRASGERVVITVYDEEAGKQADTLMAENFPNLEPMTFSAEGSYIQKNYRLGDAEIARLKEYAMRQAVETLRNRIDKFGLSEPTLQRQDDNRILVQLPGVEDPQRAIDLLGKTARLEFKMVMDNANPQDAINGNLPQGGQLLYERRVDNRTGAVTEIPLVVESKTILTGDLLSNAQVRIDSRFNEPYVAIDFNSVGAKRFDQITGANKGRRMAIVLDDVVYSAPVINERISGGSAQISGRFNEQEATDLAIVLSAGSLLASVETLENRTVGPSLGQDSINQGFFSIMIGGLLVVLAMLIYYRLSGLIANVVLVLN